MLIEYTIQEGFKYNFFLKKINCIQLAVLQL